MNDGIERGINEHTIIANGRRLKWNSWAIIVDKKEHSKPINELQLSFTYYMVYEQFPGIYIELTSYIHDSLSDAQHSCFFSTDLKYTYFGISLHLDDHYVFTFTI